MAAASNNPYDIHKWLVDMINSSTTIEQLVCVEPIINRWAILYLEDMYYNKLYRDAIGKYYIKLKFLNGTV